MCDDELNGDHLTLLEIPHLPATFREETGSFMGSANLRFVSKDDLQKYESKDLLEVIYEEKGNDSMQLLSSGLQVLIINDSSSNFLPVIQVYVT